MSAATMVMTMAMTVSMYGVLRFHFAMILDLGGGGAGVELIVNLKTRNFRIVNLIGNW
jgi:hypothetical protein